MIPGLSQLIDRRNLQPFQFLKDQEDAVELLILECDATVV